ncbi:ERMES complex subunit mmm1 [Coniosporium apollinis]|uniref:Maintenance of mitochondrial morphology protein 1 n=1 Tax=Coniosporium apollinis TaxID=61459 RepID=A0ABQ9NTS5_9PEZI|nr:ERMES complex subunit mmm1 [Coniosporium apollinis]
MQLHYADQAAPDYPPPSQSSSLSFTQGFLLGQLSIALLIVFFIKFFIFGELPSADTRAEAYALARRQRTLSHAAQQRQQQLQYQRSPQKRPRSSSSTTSALPRNLARKPSSHVLRNPPPLTTASILRKTFYNTSGHQPESLDWFNVLVAQTIAGLRQDASADDAILTSLTTVLNGDKRPDWLGEIRVTEIALGEEFPIFSNCRVIPVEDGVLGSVGVGGEKDGGEGGGGRETRLQARMDVDLSDVITLGVETTLVLNYPKPVVAVLPVALAVSVVRFSGTLSLSFIPSPPPSSPPSRPSSSSSTTTNPAPPTSLAFTFLDDYRLDLSVRSLLGSRSRLQDIPKIAELVESRLHAWFDERCVEPRFQQIVLPSLWPRKRNTRGGEEDGDVAVPASDQSTAEAEAAAAGGAELRDTREPHHEVNDANDNRRVDTHSAPSRASRLDVLPRDDPPDSDSDTLESRLARDGALLREAEERAGERPRRPQAERFMEREGLSRRGSERGSLGMDLHRRPGLGSRESSWGPWRRMPGSLPT